MEDKNLFVYVNGAGQKIKTSGLTVNQNSTNNVLNFISVGKYSSVTCSFKYANGKVSAEYHMIPQGKYQLKADDVEAVLTENADNLYLYAFTIPYDVTSSYISGNSARMNVSFAGYAYDNKQYLKQTMTANTQIVINQAVQSDTLDQSYNAADVENMWRAIGNISAFNGDIAPLQDEVDQLELEVADHETRIYDLEHTYIINYVPGTGILFTGNNHNTITADTSILALKTDLDDKQDVLPAANGAGKVLKSTSTAGVYEWGDGGKTYTAGTGVNISAQNVISADMTVLAYASNVSSIDNRVTTIEGVIPSQASTLNQLADKAFVNSSISSATGTFIGNFATKAELNAYTGTLHNNDYAIVQADETHSNQTWRYKYNGSAWVAEYMINDTALTSAQLAALNSGATAALIGQISTNQTAISNITNGSTINSFSAVESALAGKADDTSVVHKANDETITGKKTFSTKVQLVNSNNYLDVDNNNATVIGAAGGTVLTVNTGNSTIASNLRPSGSSSYDLGGASYLWDNVYANKLQLGTSGTYIAQDASDRVGLYFGSDEKLKVGAETILKGHFSPSAHNTYDLGTSSNKWKDLYIAGNITDGTVNLAINNVSRLDGNQNITGTKNIRNTSLNFSNSDAASGALWSIKENADGKLIISKTVNSNETQYWEFSGAALIPYADDNNDLGSSTKRIRNLYIAGDITDGTNVFNLSNTVTLSGNQTITGNKEFSGKVTLSGRVDGDLLPYANNTSDLGSSAYKWKNLFLNGNLNLGSDGLLKYDNSAFIFNDEIRPSVTESFDLGSGSYKWKDVYFSGDINKNASGYGLALPSTASYAANKTLAITDDIKDGVLTIQVAGTQKGTFSANQNSNVTVNITAADLGLSGSMAFIGTTTTVITDGSVTNPISIGGNSVTAQNGNVVLYDGKEYIWNGYAATPCWEQLGDESSYALKTITVTGDGVLSGGGSLEQNRVISHNEVLGSAVTTSDVYKLKIDKYGHISEAVSAGLAAVATSGSYNDLSNTPSIPTKVSDLQNDSGFTTNTGTVTSITAGAGLNTTSNDTGTDGGSISTSGTLYLTKTAVTPGTYQGITVDKYGRVTGATNQGYTSNAGTVTSVRVQAGTGLTSSQSTSQSSTLDTTISIASGYKLPTTSEWSGKQDASTAYNTSNIVYSATEPQAPVAGMIWLQPVE